MAGRPPKKQQTDWGDWGIIAFLFFIGVWPVALFLIFMKLFGNDEKKQDAAPPLYTGYQQVTRENTSQRSGGSAAAGTVPQGGKTTRSGRKTAGTSSKKMMRSPVAKSSTSKWLRIIGVILLAVGTLSVMDAVQVLLRYGDVPWWNTELLDGLAFAVAGGAFTVSGLSMNRSLKRYSKYLAVMGDREAMSVSELARTLGYSERKVEKDLQKMIDKGYFGGKAYLNMELGYLFRSSSADAQWKRQQEQKAAPKEAEEGYSGILRAIRRANDRIADPALSLKIDRLEEITAKIFREVEAHPEKQSRISTFLNYYLPTTQKLLDSYAQFESAGVEGENLRQAKSRIEATMDSIVRGFEHQLDALYHADAMDIDSDIRVMETMLRRDTARVEDDFGSSAAVAEEEF